MGYTPVKIDDHRHEKMKRLAGNKRGAITEEYRKAIDEYIARRTQESLIEDSYLEQFINTRVSKAEDHIASMLGRTGMDVSMTLMGLLLFLEKFFKGQVSREALQEQLRKDGARYFSTAIQKDKSSKRNSDIE